MRDDPMARIDQKLGSLNELEVKAVELPGRMRSVKDMHAPAKSAGED
jgi:hypothetical protein